MARTKSPSIMLTASQRRVRYLLWIGGLFAFFNPTPINAANGVYQGFSFLLGWQGDQNWKLFAMAVLGVAIFILLAIMARRLRQAVKDTSLVLLGAQTLGGAMVIGLVCWALVLGGLTPWQGWQDLPLYLAWTWQPVMGFFMAKGLNWTIEDRIQAGIQGTQEVDHHAHDADHAA